MLLDNACLRTALTNTHPDLLKVGFAGFRAQLKVLSPADLPEVLDLALETDSQVTLYSSHDLPKRFWSRA